MEPKAQVETNLVNEYPTHKMYTVKIDNTVVNTTVTGDYDNEGQVQKWFERNSIIERHEDGFYYKPKKCVLGLQMKWITIIDEYEYEDEDDFDCEGYEGRDTVVERDIPAVIALCYGTECLIYQSKPLTNPEPHPFTTLILIPRGLEYVLQNENYLLVGRGVKKEMQRCENVFYTGDFEEKCIDVECIAHPAFNLPDMDNATLRSLGRRIFRKDVETKKIVADVKWDDEDLSLEQVEMLAVSTFTSAKIGITLGL